MSFESNFNKPKVPNKESKVILSVSKNEQVKFPFDGNPGSEEVGTKIQRSVIEREKKLSEVDLLKELRDKSKKVETNPAEAQK